MQFRQKIEAAILPLAAEVRGELAQLRTLDVLNHYQFRINLSQLNKDKLPDGFWAKGRYVSALALSGRFLDTTTRTEEGTALTRIDDLVETIYDLYTFGAVYEPGKSPGSEPEFLARLGLGLRVREPDALGFPEQFRAWAMARFPSFNERYFLPTFGLTFEEISNWLQNLSVFMENRLNGLVDGLRLIFEDVNVIREQFASGALGLEEVRERSAQLRVPEKLDANAREGEAAHILSFEQIKGDIPDAAAKSLLALFGIRPGEIAPDFRFPHSANPLDLNFLVTLPNGTFYFLDPASAERVMARVFENAILDNEKLRTRYLRRRDRALEKLVLEDAKKVFPGAGIYPNYYLQKGSHEKDLLVLNGKTLILIECKNSRVRGFRGAADDLLKFESDFANSVQLGYDQAIEVKRCILASEETTFYDEGGNVYFVVPRAQIEHIFIVCVTPTTRGPFGTNLSYELKKESDEPFPLSLGLFDFQTICKHFDAGTFIEYLKAREFLHGHATTGDELNFAGYFLKFGHLNLQEGEFLTDDFSSIFDRKWYRERGVEVEESPDKPFSTSMRRKGNRIYIEHGNGKKEVVRLPSWGKSPIRMKGSERNKPCPCESGLKLKHCCGVS